MARMTLRRWATTFGGMFIQGGSNAAVASLGLLGANTMGVDVSPLNFKQLTAVFIAGAVIKTLRFLEQSPIPDFDPSSGDTTTIQKEENKL